MDLVEIDHRQLDMLVLEDKNHLAPGTVWEIDCCLADIYMVSAEGCREPLELPSVIGVIAADDRTDVSEASQSTMLESEKRQINKSEEARIVETTSCGSDNNVKSEGGEKIRQTNRAGEVVWPPLVGAVRVIADRGPEPSDLSADVYSKLDIEIAESPKYSPRHRGVVERWFQRVAGQVEKL